MSLGNLVRAFEQLQPMSAERENIQTKLIEFHRAMNVPILDTPQIPAEERVKLRLRLVVEECFELLQASLDLTEPWAWDMFQAAEANVAMLITRCHEHADLERVADALADIAYVVEGSNLEFGIDSGPVLDEVHRANMAKAGGPVREDGKRMKPAGWTPPDIAEVLRDQLIGG